MGSLDRILTTHVGSLPREPEVVEALLAEDRGDPIERAAFDRTMASAVEELVRRQVEAGVDVVSDGESSKISYATYIRHRLSGFEVGEVPRLSPRDLEEYPEYRRRMAESGTTPRYRGSVCRGPIAVRDLAPLEADIAHLWAAARKAGARDAFMNAASPGVIAIFQPNEHYASDDAYLEALGEAMRAEYETIVAAGLRLQVDCPDLAMGRHIRFPDASEADFVRRAERQVEVLNHALRGVPAERARMHLCWGNYEGPHHRDIPLERILPVVLRARPQAILFEAANPRHAHEWKVWAGVRIPEDKVLVPGVVDTTTNFIEHPELVAERLERFAGIVGRERVMAGTDCGFGTFAAAGAVHPSLCWPKLGALAEGARLASRRLWS